MRLHALWVVGLLGSACAGPQADPMAEEAAVRARSEGVAAAEAAQDIEASLAFWAPDAIVQPAGAPQIQGRDGIRALYDSFFTTGVLKEFEGTSTRVHVSQSGELAYEYGVNRMILNGPEGDLLDMGKYLAVWQKIEDEWYVVALSFTSDTPAPVTVAAP